MDNDRTTGIGHQIKGTIKEAAGKIIGDDAMIAEGRAEKMGGKLQEGLGKGKDAVRDSVDSLKP